MRPKVLIALNTAWNLYNFRAGLLRALLESGYDVVAVAPADNYTEQVVSLGCRFVPLSIDSQGKNPFKDLLLLWRFIRLLRNEKPNIFLAYTVKPNIYGSIAAHLLDIPVINNISGLGAVFIENGILAHVVRCLYRFSLSRSRMVFFQNNDDRLMFLEDEIVPEDITDLLPGSGIDLSSFSVESLPNMSSIRFLLVARMLWDKGVGEYVEAARILKRRGVKAEFSLLGFLEVDNPAAINRMQMEAWVNEGIIRYLGVSDNVRKEVKEVDCVVLPSYREGTPRTLLEAAAMGRPIITTNAVGCKEVVDDNVNGYLCHLKDATDLAGKMEKVVTMTSEEREMMGLRGRKKVESEFDERIVIEKYIEIINYQISLMSNCEQVS